MQSDEIMEKLIFKGDQKSLQIFQNENKFFFVNEEKFNVINLEEEFSSLNVRFCFQQFSFIEKNNYLVERKKYENLINANDDNDKFLIKAEGPKLSSENNNKIKSYIENLENIKSGKSNKLCFML